MTIAANYKITQLSLGFDEFIDTCGGDNTYELIDGGVFDLEPTGFHKGVAALMTVKICDYFPNLPKFKIDLGTGVGGW